jgi:hypothetical protein
MIKENVLRKNLLTNEIDYGNVDSEFEAENLNGNIIQDSPWVEIAKGSIDYINYHKQVDLKTAQTNKYTLIENAYSLAQFALVKQNGSIFKMELRGNNWLDFERQLLKASINGVADLIAINEAGILKVLKDIPFVVLQPLYKSLCGISVGNYAIKNQLLYQVNNAQDSSAVENIVITFPEIQTFTIG